jgi:hypothetical protein
LPMPATSGSTWSRRLDRAAFAKGVSVGSAAGGRLDGAVMAAGLGPTPGRDRPRMIVEVNTTAWSSCSTRGARRWRRGTPRRW